MYNIEKYYEASTVREAVQLLADNPDLLVIAGGTDVLIKMHGGKIEKAGLLSLRKVKSLEAIEKSPDGLISIGSLVTFTQLANDPVIKDNIPALAEASLSMGGPQIRNMATIGGNLCNGVPSADSAPALFALDAQLRLQDKEGERVIPIQEFFLGPGKVALKQGEILTEILVSPENYNGYGGHYIKFSMRKAMDIATLGVAVVCKLKDKGTFDNVRIGLGVAGPTPLRCREAEEYAREKAISSQTLKEIARIAVKSTKARSSWRASKEYREHLVEELTWRALKIAVGRAGGVEID
ncbi:MAG: xanthine dehydrogenase FAD-binding subunit XdhB [Bacillota bacterium]